MTGLLTGIGPDSRLLEPAGGDGAFVAGLLARGDVAPSQITVWDLDPACEAEIAARGVTFVCRDALLGEPAEGPRRFTHAIGNPPYLNKQSDYIKTHREQLRAKYAHLGVNDAYALFIAMALDELEPDGQLIFLVSDTFLTLGIHRRLRHLLLTQTRIDSITLLPDGTFPGAAVHTAVLAVTKTEALATPHLADHHVVFRDLRRQPVAQYAGGTCHRVPQVEIAENPGYVFAFTPEAREVLATIAACPGRLLDHLDGGLGLYTRDNRRYLRVVDHPGTGPLVPAPAGQDPLPAHLVTAAGGSWRFLHKRGGDVRWWRPAEHAVAWDPVSRSAYGIPASALADREALDESRRGLVVSGVASKLSARAMTPGALWESNKVFGFYPRDGAPPAELFIAVLNSEWYSRAARVLNHTVSLQIRDLAALPWLPFTAGEETELTELGRAAIEHTQVHGHATPVPQQARIDALVARAAARAHTPRSTDQTSTGNPGGTTHHDHVI